MNEQERRRTIDQALVQMEKQFGKGTILRLGSKTVLPVLAEARHLIRR